MTHRIALSGGMDSTALASTLPPDQTIAYSFAYGQRHARELDHAAKVAHRLGIDHHTIDLSGLLGGSALTGQGDIPEGHYAADTMTATVVGGRNLLFASVLVAASDPGDTVHVAVHAGDHPIYPDCRPTFWQPYALAVAAAYGVLIDTPFITWTKAQIIERLPDAPYDLSWSCYQGGERHCGRCGTCVERAEAFHLAARPDPTDYESPDYWQAVTV